MIGFISIGPDIVLFGPDVNHRSARPVPINRRSMNVVIAYVEQQRKPAQPANPPRSRRLEHLVGRIPSVAQPVVLLLAAGVRLAQHEYSAVLPAADNLPG